MCRSPAAVRLHDRVLVGHGVGAVRDPKVPLRLDVGAIRQSAWVVAGTGAGEARTHQSRAWSSLPILCGLVAALVQSDLGGEVTPYGAAPRRSRRICCRTCRFRLARRLWCRLGLVSMAARGSRGRADTYRYTVVRNGPWSACVRGGQEVGVLTWS